MPDLALKPLEYPICHKIWLYLAIRFRLRDCVLMKLFADVAIPPLPSPLSYRVPELIGKIEIGSRVTVPLGRRTSIGYIVGLSENPPPNLKSNSQTSLLEEFSSDGVRPIDATILPELCFSSPQLEFFKKVAAYYGAPLSQVIDVAIPTPSPSRKVKVAKLTKKSDVTLPARSKKCKNILDLLEQHDGALSVQEINRHIKTSSVPLKKLLELGLVEINETAECGNTKEDAPPTWAQTSVSLNAEQNEALKSISSASHAGTFKTILLHGITGSGKTEVYIEAAKETLAAGKSVLIIVPEIALTPQLIDRFRARLGNNIGTLHSGLSKKVRWESWQKLLNKECFVAIGARSALFAPIEKVGLIVVDEEHDGSFKQSEGLRYNARDMAILRGQLEGCPVVLGSATPSLESYFRARSGKYSLLSLPLRHAKSQLLPIDVVDLRTVKPWEMPSPSISPVLLRAIEDSIAKREQVFLLYNRRGFASFLQCDECGDTVECPQCSVTLTYHQHRNSLLCHYCGVAIQPMEFCPACVAKSASTPGKLQQRGGGTEKVFDEVAGLFPDVFVDRLDRDTATNVEAYKSILNKVRTQETAILVGTQMIAKGHDLPNVTLVGVVDCDVGIHMPDFRASERAFQLLTQVAGRAGRGEKAGRVILQTRTPHHISIRKTVENDYEGFAKVELGQRQRLGYPPFSRLFRIVASSAEGAASESILISIKEEIQKLIELLGLSVSILGPAPAPLQKLKGLFRHHLLLKSPSSAALNRVLHTVCNKVKYPKEIRLTFDMDPYEML